MFAVATWIMFLIAQTEISAHCVGWFALSVPSGMGLYWLTSNVLSAGQQLYFRNRFLRENEMRASRTAERRRDAASPKRDLPDVIEMPSTDEGVSNFTSITACVSSSMGRDVHSEKDFCAL